MTALVLGACDMPRLPSEPADLPQLPEMPDVLRDLGLPDISQIPNLPSVNDLPSLNVGPNAIAFAGPSERRIGVGETIPGTDIQLVSVADGSAEFLIDGLRANRALGDSLDYEGAWRGANGVNYSLRLRVYNIGGNSVRAAGVHRLVVENIQPVEQNVNLSGETVSVPYAASVDAGQIMKGLTFGYAQSTERGAEITGLPTDVYPYRKIGDSIQWEGQLRSDIPIEYNLRVLLYNGSNLQVGGVATLQVPSQ
ncbi:MAG: hypothetical protein R2873_15945 [Caldilineaceae bacterium]|nr:hypothetical protein [Caldilineaceae bacterium]